MQSMGFVGALPTGVVAQMLRALDFSKMTDVYVACSGSFRCERGLLQRFPHLAVHSNDVSLLTCTMGHLAAGQTLDFTFKGELAFIEELGLTDYPDRVSALLVALNMSAMLTGKRNRFKDAHRDHYKARFLEFVERTREKISGFCDETPIASFTPCDWTEHVERAIETGSCLFSSPPTFAGGYEKLYAFIHDNTTWSQPAYKIFDPADLPKMIDHIDASGIPFLMCADQLIEGRKPLSELRRAGKRPIYCYGREHGRSSFSALPPVTKAFGYAALDPRKLTADSKVTVRLTEPSKLNFLKAFYLKKEIMFGQGDLPFLVFIDGMLAGGLDYRKQMCAFGSEASKELLLLTDFSVTQECRVSKLISRIASSHELVGVFERRAMLRYPRLRTIAFSNNPVAMKYRGSWELVNRQDTPDGPTPYRLVYTTDVRKESLQDAYAWWWRRDGAKQVAAAQDRDAQGRPADAEAA